MQDCLFDSNAILTAHILTFRICFNAHNTIIQKQGWQWNLPNYNRYHCLPGFHTIVSCTFKQICEDKCLLYSNYFITQWCTVLKKNMLSFVRKDKLVCITENILSIACCWLYSIAVRSLQLTFWLSYRPFKLTFASLILTKEKIHMYNRYMTVDNKKWLCVFSGMHKDLENIILLMNHGILFPTHAMDHMTSVSVILIKGNVVLNGLNALCKYMYLNINGPWQLPLYCNKIWKLCT